MKILESLKDFFSSIYNIFATIIVGIISILGILTLVRKSSENNEKDILKDIEDKKDDNEKLEVKINKNEGVIDFLSEKEGRLLQELNEEKKDDSENLEDFFDKRGF